MKTFNKSVLALALTSAMLMTGCSDGDDGKDGAPGAPGEPGIPGTPGAPAGSTTDSVASAADLMLTLDPADIVVVGANPFSIKFTAEGKNAKGEMVPFTGLDKIAIYVTNQGANGTDIGSPLVWTNHSLSKGEGYSMYCSPTGTTISWGNEVNACTLVEDEANPGTYTGTWEHDGVAPIVMTEGNADALHRVMIRTYNLTDADGNGVSDKALSTVLDFIPATGEIATSAKDTVSNAACIQCHSKIDGFAEGDERIANIHAHHNYQQVENCIACHNPTIAGGEDDPEKGFNADFGPMVHRIHAGHHIADMLEGEALAEFGHVGFPAELNECTVCHDGAPSFQTNITADACESCHINVNFATGEGHSEFNLAQPDDSGCMGCHGTGGLSPTEAHKIGRRDAMMAADAFIVAVEELEVIDNGEDDGMSILRATSKVTVNGATPADDIDFAEYMTNSGRGLLIGNVDENGAVTRGLGMKIIAQDDQTATLTSGTLVTEKLFDDARLTGTLYATAEVQFCGDGEQAVKCDDETALDAGFANESPIFYKDLDGTDPVTARIDDPARTSVDEANCNTCHENLTHVKGTHGADDFNQCMDCHNETWGGSYHIGAQYITDEVDEDGNPIYASQPNVAFFTRDLVTVSHRYHSGLWDREPVVTVDADGELHGYPATKTDCAACHNEDAKFFGTDGGLFSGKRAMAVATGWTDDTDDTEHSVSGFVSPVAESCRTCHAHSDEAALAHFRTNGAFVANTVVTDAASQAKWESEVSPTADMSAESCGACHAEGKSYGIDTVHAGGAH